MNLSSVEQDHAVEAGEIVLDGLDFFWPQDKVETAVQMWKEGTAFEDIVERLHPERAKGPRYRAYGTRAAEVFLLLLHLSLKQRITCRPGGIFGNGVIG